MKKLKFALLIAILFIAKTMFAQHQKHQKPVQPPIGQIVEHLGEVLTLTDNQITQLEAVIEKYKPQLQALHDQDFKSRAVKHEAFKQLHDRIKVEVDAVLTDAQKAILKELHQGESKSFHADRRDHPENDALKTALENYRNQNVKPIMLAQRAKLEAKISVEDQATIDSLRAFFKTFHQAQHERNYKHTRQFHHERSTPPAQLKTLKSLVDKYKNDMNELLLAVEPLRAQWQADKKAIIEQHLGELSKTDSLHIRKMHHVHEDTHQLKGLGRFLLLDSEEIPNTTAKDTIQVLKLEIYPNPSAAQVNLTYEVKQAGKVTITLQDDKGSVVKTLANEYREAGIYNLSVNQHELKDGIYYYVLSNGQQRVSTKTIITKQ